MLTISTATSSGPYSCEFLLKKTCLFSLFALSYIGHAQPFWRQCIHVLIVFFSLTVKALSYLFSNSKPSNNNKWHHKLIVLLNLRLSSRTISEIVFARSLGGKGFNDAPQCSKQKERANITLRSIRLKISEIADNTMQCQYVTLISWTMNRPFPRSPQSLFQGESFFIKIISSNFIMNEAGYSQQRLRT